MGRSTEIAAIDRLFRWGAAVGDDDARLLERFRDGRDEAAFAALVHRHGPMVLGVCRRTLRDDRDVEDAFQATFLILARRAATIRGSALVGPWLHGVARRVATRARADSARRFVREGVRLEAEPSADAPPSRDADRDELRAVVDAELGRLPARFRDPVILCHLEGLTHDQAADRLRLPVGTVRSRLSRARARLRDRLERRGLSAADAPAILPIAEPLPTTLLEATLRSSLASVPNSASTLAAAGAVALADGVMRTMLIPKTKLAAVALGTMLTLGGASGYALQQAGPDPIDATPKVDPTPPKQAASPRESDETLAGNLRTHLAKTEKALNTKRYQEQFLHAEIESMEKDVEVVRKKIDDLEARIAASRPGATLVKSTTSEPRDEARTAGSSGPPAQAVYLAERNGPMVVSLEDGHVATAFVFADYVSDPQPAPGGKPGRPAGPTDIKALKVGESDRRSVRLAAEGSPPIEVVPINVGPFQALMLKGDRVERIAVYNESGWSVQELSEPTRSATPVVNSSMVSYAIGRRLYNYSQLARRWDVLELPEGAEPQARVSSNVEMILKHGDQFHRYDVRTGRWSRLDVDLPPELGRQLVSPGSFE
ncbi:sigma-70 family RNA polymerase sigma factor [Paludisphaera sp.]|uniref:RNA polymerase sigma factor n=1 Tax=Paludisphaera sp. TaxID=2017432 RepID=UPI00301BB25B